MKKQEYQQLSFKVKIQDAEDIWKLVRKELERRGQKLRRVIYRKNPTR